MKHANVYIYKVKRLLWVICLILRLFDATHGSLALKAYQQNLYLKYYY